MIFKNIIRLCGEQKITISKLERETGISKGSISKWRECSPRIDNVKNVADYFGVLVDDLLSAGVQPMKQMEFHKAMKAHCIRMNAECENCCMRLYCYTPPCEKTDSMMETVISFLATEHIRTGSENRSDHCTGSVQMPCPCNMDMSTALGYESHQ